MEEAQITEHSNFYLSELDLDDSWIKEEDKLLENMLLTLPEQEDAKRLEYISSYLPTKTIAQVVQRYRELIDDINAIESGLVPLPKYADADLWERVEDEKQELPKLAISLTKKKTKVVVGKSEKKSRNPEARWTIPEHMLFLEGLDKLGKGDWRGISRQFVKTRTPAQVASHAQKYYLRLKDQENRNTKKRKSIHDITLNIGSETQQDEQQPVVEAGGSENENLDHSRQQEMQCQSEKVLIDA